MLAFLHTSAVHVETFGRFARQCDDSVPVNHEVRADLLEMALASGADSELLRSALCAALQQLAADGASVIVCTCSTIGGVAEAAAVRGCTVLRVDRAVAEEAVASGRRILLVAALATALQQTQVLLCRVALERGHVIDVVEVVCEHAWAHFERGDTSGYLTEVAKCVASAACSGDLVLLAQASMAAVAQLIDRSDVIILSSPQLGVQAALAAYRSSLTPPDSLKAGSV